MKVGRTKTTLAAATVLAASGGLAFATSAPLAGCGTTTRFVGQDDDASETMPIDDASTTFGDDAQSDDGGTLFGSPTGTPMTFDDFKTPVLDAADGGVGALPANAPAQFGPLTQGAQSGGPCLIEPESNALLPRNWLRPRFRWSAASGQNVFELRIHAGNQTSDLTVYTSATSWTMPQKLWDSLRLDSNDVPMTVSIRGGTLSGSKITGVALGAKQPMGVAPAEAAGTIVYWTTADGTTLKGFRVGDESVGATLVTTQVQSVPISSGHCMGCHTGTPDGEYSVLTTDVSNYGDFVARVDPDGGTVGAEPPFLGAAAKTALAQGPVGISAVSKAHWTAGDHVVLGSDDTDIVWIDLEATSAGAARGAITRSGTQTGGTAAVAPAWSHDGKTIVYVAAAAATAGRPGSTLAAILPSDPGSTADLFRVPYNDRKGGAISPVTGANDPNLEEYFPSFSPDDAFLAYTACANGLSMYNQTQGEVYVVPSQGGTATRLRANDPAACGGSAMKSPGVTNSWPKWAPAVTKTSDGRSFYWVVFSSRRFGTTPQLFITGVVVNPKGKVASYGSLYLWNQPSDEGNHTPAWEYFNVPPPPPPTTIPK